MSTPSTTIYICSGVPLNNRYDHTLYFASSHDQATYFSGKVAHKCNNYTYVRKSWKLKVTAAMEAARRWSYLFFRNGENNKKYFYFITQIEYISDVAVELTLELDVMQTYMFEWVLRPCYIDREHSEKDMWGENTLDEGLDVGELITSDKESFDMSSNNVIMMAASIDLHYFDNAIHEGVNDTVNTVWGSNYDNVFGSFSIACVPLSRWAHAAEFIGRLSQKGQTDALFTMWQYPARLLNYENIEGRLLARVKGATLSTFTLKDRPTSIDGYKPKNNKVLQYPYCFVYTTNNAGGAAVYHYEHFSNESRTFRIQGNIAPDAVVKLVPVLYKGVDHNYDEALSLSNFPVCAWNSDTYKIWLAQNQNQNNMGYGMEALKIVGGVASIVGGVLASGVTGGASTVAGATAGTSMIASGATGIASQLAQKADMKVQPPQSRGAFSGSHNASRGLQNFDFYYKTIDAYHAEVIDNYFSMYGYATRKVKIPNISSRPAWNYVKTIGSNVGGDFCQEDLQRINAIFDKGITFWKNPDIGNYAIDNKPII